MLFFYRQLNQLCGPSFGFPRMSHCKNVQVLGREMSDTDSNGGSLIPSRYNTDFHEGSTDESSDGGTIRNTVSYRGNTKNTKWRESGGTKKEHDENDWKRD